MTDPSAQRDTEPSGSWTPEVIDLLRDWQYRARRSSEEHYALATSLARSNIRFGIPVVALTTLVGTTVFASLQRSDVNTTFRIAVGMISVLAAVLASLQTFLRFGERAEKHRAAAERWAAIRREIDTRLALSTRGNLGPLSDPQPILDRIRDRMDQTAQQSPELGETGWLRPQRRYPPWEEDAASAEAARVAKAQPAPREH